MMNKLRKNFPETSTTNEDLLGDLTSGTSESNLVPPSNNSNIKNSEILDIFGDAADARQADDGMLGQTFVFVLVPNY